MNKTKILPSLIDRLTDLNPRSSSEASAARAFSNKDLRSAVIRDLGWLLNTINAASTSGIPPECLAYESVLNYGLPPLSGIHVSDSDWAHVMDSLRASILRYEPRIAPKSLKLSLRGTESFNTTHNQLCIEIRGQLLAEPYPVDLLLVSHVDLETNQIVLDHNEGP
ncbi:type VI secretion system baseplate subunit TssE [Halopseudomonas salegens]|uniref:type VI secretion system baseplate subunit TssE n=1 Tax=Halopseudomonas salegens TaxID=1434072 RepID=UPI0012FD37E1|nr:type VI secretion system baseplate subunit TssE [Halopseudomonas salegens]